MNKQTNSNDSMNKAIFEGINFKSILGQDNVKKRLAVLIQGWRRGNHVPPVFLTGSFGCGKTTIGRTFLAHFTGDAGQTKEMIYFDGAYINTVQRCIDLLQHFSGMNRTIYIDECHEIPKVSQNFLLTWFNTVSYFNPVNTVKTRDGEYTIDFHLNQFVFATTEPDKIIKPLRSRFRTIVLEPYSDFDLEKVARLHLNQLKKSGAIDFDFTGSSISKIIQYSRRIPRSICDMINLIYNYLIIDENEKITCAFLEEIFKTENIFPLGLDIDEVSVLKKVFENPNGVTQSFLVNNLRGSERGRIKMIEQYLVQNGLIYIDSLRKITAKGVEYLTKHKLVKRDVYHDYGSEDHENEGRENDGGMDQGDLSIVRVERESRLVGDSVGI